MDPTYDYLEAFAKALLPDFAEANGKFLAQNEDNIMGASVCPLEHIAFMDNFEKTIGAALVQKLGVPPEPVFPKFEKTADYETNKDELCICYIIKKPFPKGVNYPTEHRGHKVFYQVRAPAHASF